jgi:hypothetical protein
VVSESHTDLIYFYHYALVLMDIYKSHEFIKILVNGFFFYNYGSLFPTFCKFRRLGLEIGL